jgi:hypothetical protein
LRELAGATVCCVKGSWLSLPAFVVEPSMKPLLQQAEAQVDQQLGGGKMSSAVHAMMQAAEQMVQESPGFAFTERPDVMYRIRGADEAAIRAAFTPPVLDYFRDHPGRIVEGQGDWLLLTLAWEMTGPGVTIRTGPQVKRDGQLPADQLETLVNAAREMVALFQATVSR